MCQVIHQKNNTTKETMHIISVAWRYLKNHLSHNPHIGVKSLLNTTEKLENRPTHHQYTSKIG